MVPRGSILVFFTAEPWPLMFYSMVVIEVNQFTIFFLIRAGGICRCSDHSSAKYALQTFTGVLWIENSSLI